MLSQIDDPLMGSWEADAVIGERRRRRRGGGKSRRTAGGGGSDGSSRNPTPRSEEDVNLGRLDHLLFDGKGGLKEKRKTTAAITATAWDRRRSVEQRGPAIDDDDYEGDGSGGGGDYLGFLRDKENRLAVDESTATLDADSQFVLPNGRILEGR